MKAAIAKMHDKPIEKTMQFTRDRCPQAGQILYANRASEPTQWGIEGGPPPTSLGFLGFWLTGSTHYEARGLGGC